MNRANKINVVLHVLLTVALLGLASLVIAQNNRVRAPRRILPTTNNKTIGRRAPHTPIGKIAKLPAWVTRRHLSDKLTRMAHAWHPKGTRVAGDTAVIRQTVLLTKATPTANFTLQNAPSIDQHPFWSGDETYIYFDSDRQSATNTTGGASFNIFRLVTDGSSVQQLTTGTDNKIEPNVSSANNLICYVAGGQIFNPGVTGQQVQTTGFNLFILDLNSGSAPRQLTNLTPLFQFTDVRHPSFAPGGTDIAFAGKLQGNQNYHIYTINVAQGNITEYTRGGSNDYSPAWSPAVNTPPGATVIAYTSNAQAMLPSAAPVQASSLNPDGHDDIYVLQPNPAIPSPKRITNYVLPGVNPNNGSAPHASNRNPAWSTTRVDTRLNGIPPGQDAGGNPTNQGQILLAFASTRRDNDTNNPGLPTDINPNGSTDIYYMNASIAQDPRDNRVVTVPVSEVPYAPPDFLLTNYTGAHKLQTANPQVAIDAVDKPGLTQFDDQHVSSEDYPTFPQFFSTYRIAFQSDRGGNYDLWAASILDLDAPQLLKFNEATNEIVHVERADSPGVPLLNRFVDPGTRVRFKVRAVDYQSGVRYAYLQIKCPDSAQQSADQREHKIFYVGPGQLDTTLFTINAPYEFDAQAIKASDTSSGAVFRRPGGANAPPTVGGIPASWPGYNRYTPNVDDANAYSGSLNPPDDATIPPDPAFFPDGENGYWLRLQDDGTGTGTFQAEWDTPSGFASDMILDVILYDNAVYPFDSTGATQSNWKIYDNVWGFTTRRFNSSSQILYVGDYDTGQKFFGARFGTGDFQTGYTNSVGLEFDANPTESWMTEMDSQLFPTTALTPPNTFHALVNFLTPLGVNSYGSSNSFTPDPSVGLGTNGGPLVGQYDIWRVQCRGPVPDDVLSIYGPRTVTQPADPVLGFPARDVKVADKCVIWHSPYLSDLYVGPGTLLDGETQTRLTNFVNRGGRLFVNGQDVAFGLTVGGGADPAQPGQTGTAFLNNVLRARYVSDNAIGGPPNGFNGDFVNDQINKSSDSFGRGVHPIGFETWYDVLHVYPMPNPGNDPPFNTPPVYLSNTTIGPTNRIYGCPNTGAEGTITAIGSPDQVSFIPPTNLPAVPANPARAPVPGVIFPGVYGVDSVFNLAAPNNGNAAIMWYKDINTQGKVVFSPFGWEAINPEYFIIPNTTIVELKNRRVELMHNVLDYLRTGRLVGTLRTRNANGGPAQPIAGALIRATRPDPVSGLVTAATTFTAITQTDGTYRIEGLDADGLYNLDALKSGYITQHLFANAFHGGYQGVTDLFLIQAPPGSISGIVTVNGSNPVLPVPGAIVQAVDNADPTQVFKSNPTDSQGRYTITNVPANNTTGYTVSVVNVSDLGFSGSIAVGVSTGGNVLSAYPKVLVAPSQNVTGIDFALTQPPGTVSGTVFVADPQTGLPTSAVIAGAAITDITDPANPKVIATTGADGKYSATLNAGNYQLQASAPGYASSQPAAASIKANQNTVVDFALKKLPPGSVSGLVSTSPPQSIPIPGATITVTTSAGDTFTVTTGAVQTGANGYKFNYKIDNIPAGTTVQVTATKNGYTPKPNPNTQTVPVNSGQETQNVNFILDPLASFNSDLTLVSSPYEYPGSSITDLFSIPGNDVNNTFAFITWDATQQKYVYRPTPPADTFHLGVGYFLQETNTATILALTNPNFQTAPKDALGNYQPYPIALKNGWNLIGMPFTTSVDFSKLQIQEANGQLVNVPDAQTGSNPALGAALFTYEHGSYEIVFTMDPFRGYWLRAFRPVTLFVTPGATQGRATVNKGRATLASNVSDDGWKLQLRAKASDTASSNAYLGVSRKATDGYDQFKMEAPPAATKENVQIAFEHKDWGTRAAAYSMDVRSTSATTWEFTVTSNVLNTPVTVSWPNITTLSRHMDMQITDLENQQAISLRNRSSFTIPASQNALTHHFRLEVKKATRNPLSLTDLAVVQAGAGRAAGAPVSISYRLSRAASVAIKVMQNGRAIRNVTATGTRDAGTNQATWDLKTDSGVSVPANLYTVEVRASDEEGHVVRQVGSIVVTR